MREPDNDLRITAMRIIETRRVFAETEFDWDVLERVAKWGTVVADLNPKPETLDHHSSLWNSKCERNSLNPIFKPYTLYRKL